MFQGNIGNSGDDKWLCPEKSHVQFCDEDIGCPMMYDNKLIGIASQRFNWRTWSTNMDCGNLDVKTRYLFLNKKYVKWINDTISKEVSSIRNKSLSSL